MRITRRIGAAAVAIAAVSSSSNAAVKSSPDASAPIEEKDSAQIWFERALSLDIGDAGTPDAVQAFAMRRSADWVTLKPKSMSRPCSTAVAALRAT